MLVDSHCHLDFDDFDDLDAVIDRAREAGIGRMVSICTRPDQLDRVLKIADRFEEVYCAVGVHPHNAADFWPLTVDAVIALSQRHPKIVGIGETGLDYFYDHSPRDIQQRSFAIHAEAARRTGLPLIVHTRDADEDTIALLTQISELEEPGLPPLRGVIHCFSSGRYLAEKACELGFFVSLSGIMTFKRSEEIRDIVQGLPADRLLVETDAPYLAPVPKRGRRNEPAFVAHTARCLGEVRGWGADQVAAITTENFFRLFNRVKAD